MAFIRRRRLRLLLLLTFPPLILVVCLWLKPDEPGTPTRKNLDRVRPGMSFDEARDLLGRTDTMRVSDLGDTSHAWDCGDGYALVWADAVGTVINTQYLKKTPSERFRDWWTRYISNYPPF